MANKHRISVLDSLTINQIAAGEVVENSASVVKELVENSIDAEASEICIETSGGGLGLIRISDDGVGMEREDLILSLERHATSKILKSEDLEGISTLGFRGEALPSIASISKMQLHSGAVVEVEGGKILNVKEKSRARGTTIEVRSLFYNVPARKKFQKGVAQCTASIHKVLVHLALCHPHVQFKWINEGEERLFVEKKSSLKERVLTLLGEEFVEKEVNFEEPPFLLFGFVGGHRPNRTGQYLFVNGRFVISPFIAQKVLEGFSTRLPMHRYPLFALHLNLPGHLVDVNVHPQKREVRFLEKEKVGAFVRKGVDKALQVRPVIKPSIPVAFDFPEPDFESLFEVREEFIAPEPLEIPLSRPIVHPLGVAGSFLLLPHEEGLEVVDLNRARALLIADKLEEVDEQKLLIPIMLEFSEAEIEGRLPFLKNCGFTLRPFGGNAYACETIPAHLAQEEVQGVILELLEGKEQRKPLRSLRRSNFSVEEGKRLMEELLMKGLEKEATVLITKEELGKKFKG